jgi:ketosteroid isomerase-like protein
MITGKTHKLLFMLMLALLLSPAQAQSKKRSAGAGDQEFKTLINGYYEAWSTLNPSVAEKYYAGDPGLVFYDIAPLKYNGWSEYKEGVKKAFTDAMISARLVPNDDLKVVRRGNFAWTTVTFHLSGKPKAGGSMELDCRHTAIWEKRGARWLIVHEHVSAPLAQ